ncbi:hypothetical protein ABZ819_05105 [Streptomyces venezuelae]|uniref:hypothetical protein n=1 Tax=Streptomyces venezuelae TaxID=54571 RepID=UPI0034239819
MNTTAAALQANVTVPTIRTWCRIGAVAAIKTAGRWIIDTASLTARIAIGAMRTRKQAPVSIDLTATYTYDAPGPHGVEPTTVTPTVKRRTVVRTGANLISVQGITPLLADKLATITDPGARTHAAVVLGRASIVICDTADDDWDDDPQAREAGRLRTTYRGDIPQITVDDVLDLAAEIRTQLA